MVSTETKIAKVATDSAAIVGIAAGIGFIAKKATKESFINDPSSSFMNYAKWVLVLAGSLYAKSYLEDKGMLPKP